MAVGGFGNVNGLSPAGRAIPRSERVWSDERICLFAALAAAVFIVYGSLVPFDFRRPAVTAGAWLEHVRFTPWAHVGPLDLLVNITISLPLGFFVMGGLESRRRRSLAGLAIAVLVVGCVSALLGMSVELLQVFLPTRNSSGNDVMAQGTGGAAGAMGWIFAGPTVIRWLRRVATRRELTSAGRE
jgi:VanZ family protein